MRRLSVMAGAMSAAMVFSSIAYAQQPTAQPSTTPAPATGGSASQHPPPKTPTTVPSKPHQTPTTPTWTLFLVAVPFSGPWTITPVAAFTTEGVAYPDCLHAIAVLNEIPGLTQTTADAKKAEGSAQYLLCLPATSPSPQHGG
jgi:hypothetical protein